jgi:hypothetical protein
MAANTNDKAKRKAKGKAVVKAKRRQEVPGMARDESCKGILSEKRKGEGEAQGPVKKRRVRIVIPEEDTSGLTAAFPQTSSAKELPILEVTENTVKVVELDWEAEVDEGSDGMDVDQNNPDCYSFPRRVIDLEAPTPRVNAATGLIQLELEKFQYPYQAKVLFRRQC